jgi:hypothetical protein
MIETNYDSYVDAIKRNLSLSPEDWFFKSDHSYTQVLEHVDKFTGDRYFNEIVIRYNTLFIEHKELLKKLCDENDKYGRTNKVYFPDFTFCSPTNLRYILHSFLCLEYMKNNNLNNLNIVEIGGGYGGLCFFITNISSLFGIVINSYTIFDLPYASKLQKEYLKTLHLNDVNCYQLDNFKELNNDSFLISNYAFSEISMDIQKIYIEKIITPYITRGFLCWNHSELYQFTNKKIYIDKATRVHNTKLFGNRSNMKDYELIENNNWVEEIVVTF